MKDGRGRRKKREVEVGQNVRAGEERKRNEREDERQQREKGGRRKGDAGKGAVEGKGLTRQDPHRLPQIRPSTWETENPPEKFERKCEGYFYFYFLIRKQNLEVRGMKHLKRDDQNSLRAHPAERRGNVNVRRRNRTPLKNCEMKG